MNEGKRPRPPPAAAPDASGADEHYLLRLFVTGSTQRSRRAIENIRSLCEDHLHGQYQLEVIDIYQDAQAARDAQIIAAPTLIKALPSPLRRIIGDLSDREKVLTGLNLSPVTLPPASPTDES